MRARRSCLSVPGSSPKMLAKAATLPADEVFFDLEDSVAPLAKEEARGNVVQALKEGDWTGKTVVLRVNGVYTKWCYRDIIDVVESAGQFLDCIMIPKVEHVSDVVFVDKLLTMIEETNGFDRKIGLEVQIETATGLKNIFDIAHASNRMETLIFGPADMSASLGLPTVTAGLPMPGYKVWYEGFIKIRDEAVAGAALEEWLPRWLSLIDARMAKTTNPEWAGWKIVERQAPLIFKEEAGWEYRPDEDKLSKLDIPTLVLSGDQSEPPMQVLAQRLAERLPRAEHRWIAGGGHDCHAGKADEFNALMLMFLSRHDPVEIDQ